MEWLPLILKAIGTGVTAGSYRKAGRAAKSAADFEAAQLVQRAGEARAISQRQAEESRLESVLLQSRALAVAAASGAGASDPSVVNAIARLAGRGDYAARSRLHEGEVAGRRYEDAAAARRYEGEQAERAGRTRAMSTLLQGGLSLFDRYGREDAPGSVASGGSMASDSASASDYAVWWGGGNI